MVAVAAGLWFLYLVPTWIRRREYLATERTATRLQQTMRILAETAEIPESVRVAATARDAARAERLLRTQQRREDAPAPPDALRRQRMRRSRRLASLGMVGATFGGFIQISLIATTGAAVGSWVVLGICGTVGALAIAVQRRLDMRSMPLATPRAQPRRTVSMPREIPARRPIDPAPWTPVPLPQPLYLSRPAVQPARPVLDAAALAREAAARAEVAALAARPSAPVVPLRADPPAAARATNRYAAMGILDPADTAAPDLDEVLRRRRTAG